MWRTALLVCFVMTFGECVADSTPICVELDLTDGEMGDNGLPALASQIGEHCQTGTLIFSRGDCLAIKIYTGSGYTHVAAVVKHGNSINVYDSMNGVGVRRLTLSEYLETQQPDEVRLFQPRREFTDEEAACFRAFLESQLGRPYSVKHHLTGKKAKGVHCSEYVTEALIAIDWLQADNPVKVSPASLVTGIESHGVHAQGPRFEVPFVVEPIPEPTSCCGRWWQWTKSCTVACCRQFSRSVFCR